MLHVLFRVGEAEYVISALDVVQMESFQGATRVPGTAPYVAGLVQIRGRVVPVIDLRVRFGLPPVEPTLDTRVVVVRQGAREVGLVVDRAREVVRIPPDAFHAPPPAVAEQAAGFIHSVAQPDKRLVLRVDFEKVIGREPLPQETRHATEA